MTTEAPAKDMRDRILTAAARLFAEQGYQATSTRAIAKAVGIAQPTLWYYFRSKELILLHMFTEAGAALLEGLERIQLSEASPLEKLQLALQHHISNLSEFSNVMTVVLVEFRRLASQYREEAARPRDRHVEILASIIEAAMAAGELRPLDPRLLALSLMALPNWIYQRMGPGGFSTQQLASFLWELIYAGARPDGGLPGGPAARERPPARALAEDTRGRTT